MKQIITLAFLLGLTTAVSAQFLLTTGKMRDKTGTNDKTLVINLDTMSKVQYAYIGFKNKSGGEKNIVFDLGDSFSWTLIDADKNPIKVSSEIEGYNVLYGLNWAFHTAINRTSLGGTSQNDYLFKRRAEKQ